MLWVMYIFHENAKSQSMTGMCNGDCMDVRACVPTTAICEITCRHTSLVSANFISFQAEKQLYRAALNQL